MQLPYIPADVPFTGDQKAWLAGFLAGLNTRIAMPTGSAAHAGGTAAVDAAAPGRIPLQIVYGSQTGTAEWLSEQAEAAAREHGFEPVRCDLDALDITALSAARRLLVITSTYGEGDMPDNAELFWQSLAAPDAPRLDGLYFGVLALGDSIYDGFCQAGKNIDARLAELGGTRVVDRVDCDVDFEDPATDWMARAVPALAAVDAGAVDAAPPSGSAPGTTTAPTTTTTAGPDTPARSAWTRKNPYPATVVANTLLSAPTSDKEVRHLEISLGDSGIDYQPGDGISISPVNDAELVDRIITRLGASPDTVIADRKTERTLREALTHHYEISTPSKYLLDYIAQRSQDAELTHLTSTGDREALDAWMWGKDVLDLLDVDPTLTISPDELIAELRPLQHRVYSISSSPLAHAGTVHITMATVRYRSGDRQRGGVCSTFLADRRPEGTQVGMFISPNNSFRLPSDDTKAIMIGPGTGIAPFRSFLHERAARGARGGNWLFFGDQRRDHDYIYADEIDGFVTDGLLDRLDLAFSRDQEHKIYVQDRMREQGADLFRWLSDGAHIYVCGDATRMARDVDTALREVVAEHGGLTDDEAQDYIDDLKRAKRYLRDVY
ncbi:sulfite reductase subunit alpha [Gordonia sp. OPL2]|uniref:sulfite reductase subunit alpha n=1 Tax=Gordonia sp. OPL2 TaxID=2486274 RepID=UPI00165663B1|nr:sulfite reductase subunit alpha [Gordonia sp. OPL2]ROZ88910.1 sulfite reductase subunit alpha [Gordonia sp. OPL2]